MQVLEAPIWRDWPIPPLGPERYGHFVLLRLDPLASISALDDEEASRAATRLTGDWCLAVPMANGMRNLWNPEGRAKLQCRFCLVCAGPQPDPSHVFVPIAPSPEVSDGRPPVQLASPLPWPNLYVHTCCSYYAVISRIHHGAGHFPSSFSEEQHKELDIWSIKDRYNKEFAQAAALAEQAADDESLRASSSAEARNDSADLDSVDSSEDQFFLTDDKFAQVHICVELCTDPAACPGQPANPFEMEERTVQVEEIWHEWKNRMVREAMAKRPQTIAWIKSVNMAQGEPLESYVEPELDGPLLDGDDILPEDASGHRVEQARDVPGPAITDTHAATHLEAVGHGLGHTNTPQPSNPDTRHAASRHGGARNPLAASKKLVAGFVHTALSIARSSAGRLRSRIRLLGQTE